MLELDMMKQQVRLEPDFTDDDALLQRYANAATRYVENHTGRKLFITDSDAAASGDTDALVLNDDIKTAMMLLVGHWYASREAVTAGATSELPLGVDALISPYRHYHF